MGYPFTIGPSRRNGRGIDVTGIDQTLRQFANPTVGLIFDAFPNSWIVIGKLLKTETLAKISSRDATIGHSRLDNQGAGTTQGIDKRYPPVPFGQMNHGGSHGLLHGSLNAAGPVSPAVQAAAGGVDTDGSPIFYHMQVDP